MTSAFDYSGPSRVLAASPELRRSNLLSQGRPMRDNRQHMRFCPPVIGSVQSQIDGDRNAAILGKRNDRRSQ